DGGTLQLSGASGGIFTNNGIIRTIGNSQVQLIGAQMVGGSLAEAGSTIYSFGASLNGLTNAGTLVLTNNTTTTLVGTITNNGAIIFANAGNGVDLRLSGSVTLVGSGTV